MMIYTKILQKYGEDRETTTNTKKPDEECNEESRISVKNRNLKCRRGKKEDKGNIKT